MKPELFLDYQELLGQQLRQMVRLILQRVLDWDKAANHLPEPYQFYITFATNVKGVKLPDFLKQQYPEQMTIVLQHQFWDLQVTEDAFSVGLSFQKTPCYLTIPYDSILEFADRTAPFALQFICAEDLHEKNLEKNFNNETASPITTLTTTGNIHTNHVTMDELGQQTEKQTDVIEKPSKKSLEKTTEKPTETPLRNQPIDNLVNLADFRNKKNPLK